MKKISAILPFFAMAALILDSRTASTAAAQGVELVLRTALPSLFPFFVLSALILPTCTRLSFPWLARILSIPQGWESVFLLGTIGGYPVGAQCVCQGYGSGQLSKKDAQRMLGFCTNCGPAFLFGILTPMFSSPWIPLAVFLTNILSAFLTGLVWPSHRPGSASRPNLPAISLQEAVQRGIRSMASVSAWIILGKILLAFLSKNVLCHFPVLPGICLTGLLELTNGCLTLPTLPQWLQFPAACLFTSFGGLCVAMQVHSLCAAAKLEVTTYLPQKLTQCSIALILSLIFSYTPGDDPLKLAALMACGIVGALSKKTVEISGTMMYNKGQ